MTNRSSLRFRFFECSIALMIFGAAIAAQAQIFTLQNPLPAPTQLNGIQACGGGVVYAVGNYNTLVKSIDGGNTWTQQYGDLDAQFGFQGLYMQSATRGWACGGSILYGGGVEFTNNGGNTWGRQIIQLSNTINAVYFNTTTQGWAIGSGHAFSTPNISQPAVYYSNDFGNTWTPQYSGVPTYQDGYMTSIGFANNATGWAIGNNPDNGYDFLLNTVNSGAQWSEGYDFPYNFNLSSLLVKSLTNLYVVGDNDGAPTIGTSTDGGNTWSFHTFPDLDGHLDNIVFTTPTTVYAGGWKSVNGGPDQVYVVKSTNGGTTWTEVTANANLQIYSPNITGLTAADSEIYLCGSYNGGLVVGSNNAGKTWMLDSYNAAGTNGFDPFISATSFADTLHGWAVGYNASLLNHNDDEPVLLSTTNGGATWTPNSIPSSLPLSSNSIYTGISAISSLNIWIVGYEYANSVSFALHTSNGGANWSIINLPGGSAFQPSDISFSSATTGIIAGQGGSEIYYTSDGGTTWNAATFLNEYSHYDVFKIGSFYGMDAWACADNGNYILNSTDGGQTWTTISSSAFGYTAGYWAEGVSFIPSGVYGWVCGYKNPTSNIGGGDGPAPGNGATVLTNPQLANGPYVPFIDYTTNGGASWTPVDNFPNAFYVSSCGCNEDSSATSRYNEIADIVAVSQNAAIALTTQMNQSPYPGNRILATVTAGSLTTEGGGWVQGQGWIEIDSSFTGTDYLRLISKFTSRIDAWTLSTSGSAVAEIRHGFVNVPRFSAKPDTLFQNTILSFNPTDSAVQSVIITNPGSAPLTITSYNITGASQSVYTVVHAPFQIPAGGVDSISVKFKPNQFGEPDEGLRFVATLTITSNAVDVPQQNVLLDGGSSIALVESSPSSLFNNVIVPINGGSDTGVIHVCNVGEPGVHAVLEVGSIQLNPSPGQYSIIKYITSPILPGTCDSIIVVFAPTTGGPSSGTLTFNTNTKTYPTITVNLGGIGGVRLIASNVNKLSFTDTIGCSADSGYFVISNPGTLPVTIDTTTIVGPDSSALTKSALAGTIQPGGSDTLRVKYTPKSFGIDTLTNIVITSNAINSPTLKLSVNTLAEQALLSIPKNKIIIDTVSSALIHVTKYVAIKDTGNLPVFISPGTIGVTNFELALPFPDALYPGDTASFGVTDKGGAQSQRIDTLQFIITWGNYDSASFTFACGPQSSDTVTYISIDTSIKIAAVNELQSTANTFTLMQNYPNPFSSVTNIEYSIPERSLVTLNVYDALGREVNSLVNETENQGMYKSSFDATNLPNGNYFFELRAGMNIKRLMMTLEK